MHWQVVHRRQQELALYLGDGDMFHYEEPIFQKKKLLRIEMLEQLRDYPRNYLKLHFQGYSDGIICGCHISWDNGQLEIAPGIVYYAGNLYFLEEPYQMECRADNNMKYLKVQFMTEVHEEGKIEGNTRIVLDDRKADNACEIELCRFQLQEGQDCGTPMRILRITPQNMTR